MDKFFDRYELKIGKGVASAFLNQYDVYQDGTTPLYRDVDGRLWAMSGHSHVGQVAMFVGTCLDDMHYAWEAKTDFQVGNADVAFSGIRYPEGVRSRGSVWPFGLYICPHTHRFFCWFHNETGWNGQGSAYDAYGPCEQPKFDTDFRHVGLMHSDDEGKTWVFDRWVLSAEEVCFTSRYVPDGQNAIGQQGNIIRFGSGDFSVYVEPEGEYIYLFYNIITIDLSQNSLEEAWQRCDAYVARCRKRADGTMGDFVKYYDGAFCEAGNLGKESAILHNVWHPRVVYSIPEKMFIMTSKPIMSTMKAEIDGLDTKGRVMQISTSQDMIHWSTPEIVYQNGAPWGNHYNAIVPNDTVNQPNILATNQFFILNNHNGTDVMQYPVELKHRL
jgi:signal peptidase I